VDFAGAVVFDFVGVDFAGAAGSDLVPVDSAASADFIGSVGMD
jgi:hypothetical protein